MRLREELKIKFQKQKKSTDTQQSIQLSTSKYKKSNKSPKKIYNRSHSKLGRNASNNSIEDLLTKRSNSLSYKNNPISNYE